MAYAPILKAKRKEYLKRYYKEHEQEFLDRRYSPEQIEYNRKYGHTKKRQAYLKKWSKKRKAERERAQKEAQKAAEKKSQKGRRKKESQPAPPESDTQT